MAVLPTGYGKSRIYFHLPELFDDETSVLVISPLQALMLDQLKKLEELHISATVVGECQPVKSVADDISAGKYSIVFSSPEAVLSPGLWRRSLTRGVFHRRMKAVIIDEAHCITEWGGEFRTQYSKLSELRSVFPETTTFVALTATATKSMVREIIKKLQMVLSETTVVSLLPDRTNITYHVRKSTKSMTELDWLVSDLKTNGMTTKKTIVYCRNIVS